jgi:hypothetical protein
VVASLLELHHGITRNNLATRRDMAIPEIETIRKFVFERLLNQDTRTKSVNLLGTIDSQPAIIIAEKTAFPTESDILESFSRDTHLPALSLIEHNDIYHWFLASLESGELPRCAEAKLTLIYPATETHIRKYSFQSLRMVTETPYVYSPGLDELCTVVDDEKAPSIESLCCHTSTPRERMAD